VVSFSWRRQRVRCGRPGTFDPRGTSRHNVGVHNGPRLQSLIAEYGRLRRLQDHTPQSRGQAFNKLLANMFDCWGLRAKSEVRAKGEVDVVFTHRETRYVVEAKWENRRSDTGHIAKLQKRLRQRFAGTGGIFISMSGYTEDALADIADGEQLQILLIDDTHVEAMLSGLVPPYELIELLLDQASFKGEPYVPLLTLIGSSEEPPSVAFGTPESLAGGLRNRASADVTAEVLFTLPSSHQLGVGVAPRGQVLVTTDEGILAVDVAGRTTQWAAPVSGCHRNAVALPDGTVLFARCHGIGRSANNRVTVVGGGFFGATGLAPHPDGSMWAFASGDTEARLGASISQLGDALGDESRYDLQYPTETATASAWVNEKDLVTIGPEFLITAIGTDQRRRHTVAQSRPTGLADLGDGTVITIGDGPTVGRTSLGSGEYTLLADFDLRTANHALCSEPAGSLLIATPYGEGPDTPIAVGRIALVARHAEAPAAVSVSDTSREDTGNVSGVADSQNSARATQQQLTLNLGTREPKPVTPNPAPTTARSRQPRRVQPVATSSTQSIASELTVVDAFAGSGGMTLGFHQEGYRPILALDNNLAAAATYAANFGEAQFHVTDIRQFIPKSVHHADVLVGAPPTQGFSGWRRSQDPDPRNRLWKDFWRITERIQPYVFVMVTSPRFLRSDEFHNLLHAAKRRSTNGYAFTHTIANAVDFGVAQERQFAVIIGSRIGQISLSTSSDAVQSGSQRRTVRECIGWIEPHMDTADLPDVTTTLVGQRVRGPFRSYELHLTRQATALSYERYSFIPPGGDIRDLPQELLSPHHRRRGPQASAGIMGRMQWDRPAPTIRPEFFKPEKGRYLHPVLHRAISHYEAALLQGFPSEYQWCGSKTEIAHQIGDATPVPLAAAIARHIKSFLQ
jgi:DNA (cytosine-5)-methyltransferase 1